MKTAILSALLATASAFGQSKPVTVVLPKPIMRQSSIPVASIVNLAVILPVVKVRVAVPVYLGKGAK